MTIEFEISIVRLSLFCRITDIKIVWINACQSFIKICSILYHSMGECNIFNIQNVSLAKYSYSNIDDVPM